MISCAESRTVVPTRAELTMRGVALVWCWYATRSGETGRSERDQEHRKVYGNSEDRVRRQYANTEPTDLCYCSIGRLQYWLLVIDAVFCLLLLGRRWDLGGIRIERVTGRKI